MAPSTSDYEHVPRADEYTDAVTRPSVSEDSDSDDALDYTGRTKRRSLAEAERSRYDAETLGGQEEVERLLVAGDEHKRSRRSRGELRRMEQGGKSETSSISGGDESPVRARQYTRKVS
jgi:hypothetical protein